MVQVESNVNPCQTSIGATPMGVAKLPERHARELGKLPDEQIDEGVA